MMNARLTSGTAGFPAFRSRVVVGFALASAVVPCRVLRGLRGKARHAWLRGAAIRVSDT